MSMKLMAVVVLLVAATGGCAASSFGVPGRVQQGGEEAPARYRLESCTSPVIHGPMSASLLGDFIAPSNPDFDEAYGVDSRWTLRTWDNISLGADIGYARMKNAEAKGLIEGELLRYTVLCWGEYHLPLRGDAVWGPCVDFGAGVGWYAAEPMPAPSRREEIESADRKLHVGDISTGLVRAVVKLRVPVLRRTKESLAGGNADLIVGIGADFGTGTARYTIKDFTAGIKSKSHDRVVLDAFHAFLGLSFRF